MSENMDQKGSGNLKRDVILPRTLPFADGSEEAIHYRERKILIVDDEKGIRKSLKIYLESIGFKADEAENGDIALELLERNDYFLCLTDISMPGTGGLELLAHIKGLGREIEVVMITGHKEIDYAIEAIKQGAFDYFKKPYLLEDLRMTVMRVIEKQTLQRKSLELERLKERQKIETKNLAEFMIALAGIIDAKSHYTRKHSDRVSRYSRTIAELLELSQSEIQRISLGAKLHDIGKIGTPEFILDKAGTLTDDEYEIIKQHPVKGAEMIQPISSLKDLTDIIHYHHESLDGSGYPDGLQGGEIPIAARIVKIADYWDAITSFRPYRDPMSFETATAVLREERGKRVDPELVDIFFSHLAKNPPLFTPDPG
jgi:putative two-component system response regulator